MKANNLISIFTLFAFLLVYSTSCHPTRAERRSQMEFIQEANKKAIDKGEAPYDSVHVVNDTLFYYRNSEFQMKTIIIRD